MVPNRLIGLICFMLLTANVWGQENRYMVFFTDKVGSPYVVSSPEAFLTAKSIARRTKQGLTVGAIDIPVNPAYVSGVKATGVEVYYQTRWMNGVLIQGDASLISSVEALPFVDHVELVAPGAKLILGGRYASDEEVSEEDTGTATDLQLTLIGLNEMHDVGNHGEGITIAVLDAGFIGVNTAGVFADAMASQIDLSVSFDFVSNKPNVFQYHDHGTRVFSTMAAFQDGVFVGGAAKANYQLYVTEDVTSEYPIEEYNWLFAAEKADSLGADIITSSLGYSTFDSPMASYVQANMDGKTAVSSKAAQIAFERGMIVISSAGNEGANSWGIITAPADARDVLAIGNVNVVGTRSVSSSRGFTADKRIKPDVMAMGTSTSVFNGNGTLTTSSGTSLAAPLAASLVAGVWQQYPELTNKEIINAVRASASQSTNPDSLMGYGIPNYRAIVNYLEERKFNQTAYFVAYPNPFSSGVTIRPKDPELFSTVRLRMYTVTGQLIEERIIHFDWLNRVYEADYSGLKAGLYLFQITYEDRSFNFKMVKH